MTSNSLFNTLLFIIFPLFISACSSGGGDNYRSKSEPLTNTNLPPLENKAETDNNEIILLDNFDPIDGSKAGVYSRSSISDQQYASFFAVNDNVIINSITWAGVSRNPNSLDDNEATFIIRIHSGAELPSTEPIAESVVLANAMQLGSTPFGPTYQFSFQDKNIFNLTPGNYWIAILDPETEGIEYLSDVERDSSSRTTGNGGALRSAEGEPWKTLNSGVSARNARGRNILIEALKL